MNVHRKPGNWGIDRYCVTVLLCCCVTATDLTVVDDDWTTTGRRL